MSLVYEINNILENESDSVSFYEDSDLIRDYQTLLDNGVIKKRGFTLQTIEEKQRDMLEVKTVYSTPLKKFM